MNPHTLRILIWAIMSVVICGGIWVVFGVYLRRSYETLFIARKRYNDAKGVEHSYALAIGDKVEPSQELQDAMKALDSWEKEVDSIRRQRLYCLLVTPGIVAILALIYW